MFSKAHIRSLAQPFEPKFELEIDEPNGYLEIVFFGYFLVVKHSKIELNFCYKRRPFGRVLKEVILESWSQNSVCFKVVENV